MNSDEARALLGVPPGASSDDVSTIFRRRMRTAHPDVAVDAMVGADEGADPALLTQAYAVLREVLSQSVDGRVPGPAVTGPDRGRGRTSHDDVEVRRIEDSLWVGAPPDESFQRLLEASSTLGGIGHVDRGLGLLEVIVRFDGGPSCSVLMTLQGRSHGTEIFCEMESIESASTPPIDPVLDALVQNLSGAD